MTTVMESDLAERLAQDLETERGLIRVYRRVIPEAGSPRVRRMWEQGLAIKRRHETELEQWLALRAPAPAADRASDDALPPPRELLPWIHDREHALALRYRDELRLAEATEARRLIERWAEDQQAHAADLKRLYRDFSFA